MSMCRVISCVVGRGCLLWPVHSLHKTLLAFVLLHFVLQGQSCLVLQVSLEFLLLHFSPLWLKGHLFFFFGVTSRRLVGLHRYVQIHLLGISGWASLNSYDTEWLPWKRREIFLSFLRLHPSTAFWTLLLTMRAAPFLLRDSCPQY